MSGFPAVTGYVASVWTALRASLVWSQGQIASSNVEISTLAAQLVSSSFRNGRDAISAYLYGVSLTALYDDLSYVLTLPLSLDPTTLGLITARIATIQKAAISAASLPQTPASNASATLAAGTVSVADPLLTEWAMNSTYEAPPGSLTYLNLSLTAQSISTAWATTLATLSATSVPGATVDAVEQMALVSATVAATVANVSISQFSALSSVWNQMVVMPTILAAANAMTCDPTSASAQQIMVMRYVIGTTLNNLFTLLVQLRETAPAQIQLVTVRQNDTLMAIAARTLGDFERFTDIAKLNGLIPPYISNTPGPGLAVPGQQLYIPTAGTVAAATPVPPSYTTNYLGVDVYYGPLNADMLPWTGDYATVAGYNNLSFSLGRRLQTTLGSLIFHGDFGSRIPPEIGKVTTQATSGHLQSYAKSAILSDPRTYQVTELDVVVQASYAISITAFVLPNGDTSAGTTMNEVLQPQV